MNQVEKQRKLEVIVPPASQTEGSIALVWNKPEVAKLISYLL